MGKFNKAGKKEMPALNSSSMPDIVFAILFFFMVTTTMRSETVMVKMKLPKAISEADTSDLNTNSKKVNQEIVSLNKKIDLLTQKVSRAQEALDDEAAAYEQIIKNPLSPISESFLASLVS